MNNGFNVTHFQGGGSSIKNTHGSIGGQYGGSPNNGQTHVNVGVDRSGQLFSNKGSNTNINVGVTQQVNPIVSIGGSVSHGTQTGTTYGVNVGIKY